MINEQEYFLNDNEFIVSKTDLTGKITYCNTSFMRLAKAKIEELLHKPHNIIRHPDMPRIVFKLLWDRIKNKQEIFAFVKNQSLDGGFYWVFANVTASVDLNDKIIGYYSVRRKPRAEAVKFIEPIYKQLLEAERFGGLVASEKLLNEILSQNNTTYDELINNLQRG